MARIYWVAVDGYKIAYFPTQAEARAYGQLVANRRHMQAHVGYDEETPRPKRRASALRMKRNPMMGGVNFTGEEWLTAGYGPRGRLQIISGSRREAENDAAYLFSLGYRALTTRRIKAPVGARQTASKPRTVSKAAKPRQAALLRLLRGS